MSNGNQTSIGTSNRYRTIWISDVHLGSEGCKAKALVNFLREHECERLYLVGDIFDGWKLRTKFFWTPDHSRVIKQVISKARNGTKVYYIAGNHDDFMRQFVKKQLRLGVVRLANEVIHTTADGRRLLVMHGDTLDFVMNDYRWVAFAGDIAYELLMESNAWVNRARGYLGLPYWSLSSFAKTHVKAAVQYLSGFDNQVLHRCRKDDLQGVICGHTHHSEIRYIANGVTSYNCGDWVESCTALAEDLQGDIQLLQVPLQPQAVPAARRVTLPAAARKIPGRIRERAVNLLNPAPREPNSAPEPVRTAAPVARPRLRKPVAAARTPEPALAED